MWLMRRVNRGRRWKTFEEWEGTAMTTESLTPVFPATPPRKVVADPFGGGPGWRE